MAMPPIETQFMNKDFVVATSDDSCEIDLFLCFEAEWSAMENPFVVLNLEVTDLYESQGEIMGIQALLVSPQGNCLSQLDLLVQTQHDVPDWLLQALQLTSSVFATNALTPQNALQKFLAFIENRDVFIHNAPFDLPFIHRIASKFGVVFANKVFDTLPIAELTWPGQRCSVDGLRELLEIDPRVSTENDAKATMQILIAAREIGQAYHTNRMRTALIMRNGIVLQEASTGPPVCPFCEIEHNFQD
jgi:DNA polymerase III alpha subunit (gram-positive type)